MAVDNVNNPVLGIDLGTTFSATAKWNGRGTEHFQTSMGDDTLQSVVYLNPETKEVLVGKLAYRKGILNPENMAIGIKRKMDDASQRIHLGGQDFSPIELSARILERLYLDVKDKYPKGVFSTRGTVVTVPYYFKAHQCENTRKAAELANIECLGILQEPIAASLSYAWQLVQDRPDHEFGENILVFDLGGGTFDLTLFRLEQKKEKLAFDVIATGGDDRLGGMDFDEKLVELLLKKSGISLDGLSEQETRKARQKLLEQAIEAKIALSASPETYVAVSDVIPGKHIDLLITRSEFELAIGCYITNVKNIVEDLFAAAKMKPIDVDRVIRVGGSSVIPCMRSVLDDLIGEAKVYGDIKPHLCVAEGAAMYAAYLDDREVFGREIEIRTVTNHALGVETSGGLFHKLIMANRKTPCECREYFTTDCDNMTTLDIRCFQGSARMVKDNAHIGTVSVSGIPARPKGQIDIAVTFKVNEEQMLSVVVEAEGVRKAAAIKFA